MINTTVHAATQNSKRVPRWSISTKRAHVQAFEQGTQTMTDYCKNHKIPLSTFNGWVKKYGAQSPSFIPIAVKDDASRPKPHNQVSFVPQVIEIHRSDLTVVLPLVCDVSIAIKLIQGILSCT